jgi:ribonuclease BN (tRNA processing enzyme)
MKLTVVGCGDAFGSGGRLQTCYHVAASGGELLIDCGATALIGLNRLGMAANPVQRIFISHLHGDHYAGLVWWMLHAQHVAKRTTPLTIIGPPSIEARFVAAAEALFAGSTKVPRRFDMRFREYTPGVRLEDGAVAVTAYEVTHPSGAPSCALRLEIDSRIIAFTGDTQWVENLVPAGRDADLYIMECYALDGPAPYHLSWRTIEQELPRIGARRVMLTHMSERMLAARDQAVRPGVIHAEDGLVVDI